MSRPPRQFLVALVAAPVPRYSSLDELHRSAAPFWRALVAAAMAKQHEHQHDDHDDEKGA